MDNLAFWERDCHNGYTKARYPEIWAFWIFKPAWLDWRFENNSKHG